jgi:hypothetical protein
MPVHFRKAPAVFALDSAERLAGPGHGALAGNPVDPPVRERDSVPKASSANCANFDHRWGVRHRHSPSENPL